MKNPIIRQINLITIIALLYGCNNTPDAGHQSKVDTKLPPVQIQVAFSDANSASSPGIQLIETKISELESQQQEAIDDELALLKDQISSLEEQEARINQSLQELELASLSTTQQTKNSAATPRPVTSTKVASTTEITVKQDKPLAIDPTTHNQNPNSVYSWGNWENGIQPAAGLVLANLSKPTVIITPPNQTISRHTLQQPHIATAIEAARITGEARQAAEAEAARIAEEARQAAEEFIAQQAQQNGGTLAEGSGIIFVSPDQANRR